MDPVMMGDGGMEWMWTLITGTRIQHGGIVIDIERLDGSMSGWIEWHILS